ncbi:MAG: GGDEF domain-containing protein [Ruminococcus sp.]|nr:GGDEF domain-containing protein [Ruminococcus sp.]
MMFSRMTESKNKNISSLASFASSLLKERIVDYMDNTEKTCEIFFRSEYKDFYPDESVMSEAEINKTQDEISSVLLNISINDYFADFGIAYENGSSAGIITDSTRDTFDGDIYEGLCSFIPNGKNDGWGTGFRGNYEKLYFVKRVNDHAVITISSYTKELERRINDVTGLSDAETAVIDSDGVMICSADIEKTDKAGTQIENEPLAMITDIHNMTVQNDDYYVATDDITGNWKSICIVSKEHFKKDNKNLYATMLLIGTGAMLLSTVISLYITRRLSAAALTQLYASGLDGVDRLTKLTNKFSTEDMIIDTLESSPMGSCYGLVLVDIDNLKDINDNLGRTAGDDTILQVSNLIRSVFGENAVIGRFGGDKFETLADVTDYDLFKCLSTLEHKCAELCESLKRTYADEEKRYKVAVSVGAALYPLSSDTYEGLLANADDALRTSKQKGGSTYTVYRRADTKKDGEDK